MTFKDLTFKKKLEHIWEYYKVLIFGVIFVAVAGSSIAYAMLKPKPDNYLGLAIYRAHISTEQQQALTSRLNSAFGIGDKESVTVSNYYFQENDSVFNVQMEQKFITYLFSMELNITAAPREDTELFIDSEYIVPLEEYYSAEELAALDESGLLLYRTDPLDNKEKAFAISADNSAVLKADKIFEGYGGDNYFAIVSNENCKEHVRPVMDELLK